MDAHADLTTHDLRRRFLWARRQGRPAWLWPEVSIPAWRTAMVEIAGATSAMLADAPGARLDGDPEAIGLAGYTSGMGPLLGLWAEQGRMESGGLVRAVLDRHLAQNRIRSALMLASARAIVGRLAAAGIKAVVLKGMHTGDAYFPEAGARPASDIDLLVEAADVGPAEAALQAEGLVLKRRGRWESTWVSPSDAGAPRSLTYVHADDPWSVDLHSSLNVWAGGGSRPAELDSAGPMSSEAAWPGHPGASVLEQPLLALYLAAHAGTGWQNLTLLRQVELALVIRHDLAACRLSWAAFLDVGARTGALGYAYPALHLCEALAPGTVPRPVLGACAARAPEAVRTAIANLTPATAQRIDRASLAEHFMWAPGWRGRLHQLAADLAPDVRSWPALLGIYEERAWRIIRGRVSQ